MQFRMLETISAMGLKEISVTDDMAGPTSAVQRTNAGLMHLQFHVWEVGNFEKDEQIKHMVGGAEARAT